MLFPFIFIFFPLSVKRLIDSKFISFYSHPGTYHLLVESLVIFDDFLEVEMEGHELLGLLGNFELNGDESMRAFGINH